jgi:hypothetical protein
MNMKGPKRVPVHKKLRFAVGARIRVKMPGVNGTVMQVDDELGPLGEYWHTISTVHGDRKEPGCNLELIPTALTNSGDRPTVPLQSFHLHGDNTRINLNSTDNSTNIVSVSNEQLFAALHEKASSIEDETVREDLRARIGELEEARRSGGFLQAYQSFITSAANHMTLFAPLLPLLTQMLSTQA